MLRNILEYLSVMNYYHIDHEKTMIDEFVGYGKLEYALNGTPTSINIIH